MIGRSCTKCRKSFLLTPLREGRRKDKHDKVKKEFISTHAPAGGATLAIILALADGIIISTHAPAGGATRARCCDRDGNRNFYSRPCGRGDSSGCTG